MRLIRKLFFLIIILTIPSVYAMTMPCPGDFGISGEYLIMQHSIDQPHFGVNVEPVVQDPTQGGGRTERNVQSWHSGYRVELVYAFCNCMNDIRVRWTHFPTFSNSSTLAADLGGGIFPLTGPPRLLEQVLAEPLQQLSIADSFDFQYVDLLLSQKLFDCCPFYLDLHLGVQYGHIEFRETLNGTNGANETLFDKTKAQMWGIGPEIGTEFSYAFTKCLSLTGRGYASLLVSKKVNKRFFDISDAAGTPVSVFNNHLRGYWSAFPVFDLRFGLNYLTVFDMSCWSSCFDCFSFDIEAGYEVLTFVGGIDRPLYTGSLFGVTANGFDAAYMNEHTNFTFHGPYVHVGITF